MENDDALTLRTSEQRITSSNDAVNAWSRGRVVLKLIEEALRNHEMNIRTTKHISVKGRTTGAAKP